MTAIVALRGFIGIGKTALAAKVVHQLRGEGNFSDGIAVVFCQGLTDPAELVRRILTRFDPWRRPPEATEPVVIAELAYQLLNGKETLVVLDNIEPGLTVEKAVTPLKMAGAKVLVTARHVLPHSAVPVEAQRTLIPLSPKEALQVFTFSMGRGRGEDLAPAERQAIERIIAALSCHTLAVKLAGAYAADLHRDLETLARELEDPKRAIDLPDGETPDAVRLIFAQSVLDLPPDVQKLFAALAAFSTTDVSRNAAVALAKALGVSHPEMSVDLLVRRAFVDAFTNEQIPKESDCERLRLHLLLRAFAQEEFFNSWVEQKRDAAFQALAQYYTIYVTEAKDVALSIDEHNIAGALKWAHDHEQGNLVVALLSGMRYYWRDRWNTDAYLRYFPWGVATALAIAQATHDRTDCLCAAHLALTFGQVLQDHGMINEANEQFQVSSTLFTEGEDRRGQAAVLFQLGQSARTTGHMEEAKQYLLESLGIFREVGDRSSEGSILSVLGQVALLCGHVEEGEDYCKQALPILREVQNHGNAGKVLMMFGQIAALRGNMDEANRFLQEAMPLLHGVYGDGGVVTTLAWLGQMALASGRPHEAEEYLQKSLTIARKIQDRRGEAISLVALGLVALVSERLEDAEYLIRKGVAIYHEMQDRGQEGASSVYLAHIAERRGQFDEAEKQYHQCLEILRETQIASCAHVAGAFGMFLLERRGKT